jgi:redox-sensitive bicupin YhaK (pirin superfamily)
MKSTFFAASDRGTKDIGWLQSKFFFSFSDYYDPLRSAFGTLLAFNDDVLATGKGFGTHPHVNMEIISILLQGRMNHKDSLNYSTVIEPGGVQIMSAGSGLLHEEHNIGEDEVHFLQIWIQPKLQNIGPRYQTRQFHRADRHNRLVTIVSGEEGLGHCWVNQNAKLSMGWFDAGETIRYNLPAVNICAFVFVISGGLLVNQQKLGTRDGLGIWETSLLEIVCTEESELLIIETVINQK